MYKLRFLVLFMLIYIEPISLGLINIGHIWKSILFVFYLIYKKKSRLEYIAILFATTYIVNMDFNASFYESFIYGFRFFSIPFIIYLFKRNLLIEKHILYYSIFIILSFIPFQFGLPELSSGYSLSNMGDDDIKGIVGLFQNPHSASSILSLSVLFLLSSNNNFRFKNPLIILGIFFLLTTYVRTGLVMLFIPYLIYIVFNKKSFKKFILLSVGIFTLFLVINKNELFMNRLINNSIHNKQYEIDAYTISSGRTYIYENHLKNFQKSNSFEKLFGVGMLSAKLNLKKSVGLTKMGHNHFLDTLLFGGYFGLILLLNLLYLFYLNAKINRRLVMFSAYLIFCILQGGSNFFMEIIAFSFLLTENNDKSPKQI